MKRPSVRSKAPWVAVSVPAKFSTERRLRYLIPAKVLMLALNGEVDTPKIGPANTDLPVSSFEEHQQILYTYAVWSRVSSALCTIHEPVVIEYYSEVQTWKHQSLSLTLRRMICHSAGFLINFASIWIGNARLRNAAALLTITSARSSTTKADLISLSMVRHPPAPFFFFACREPC